MTNVRTPCVIEISLLTNEQNDELSVATGDAMKYGSWLQKNKPTALNKYEN